MKFTSLIAIMPLAVLLTSCMSSDVQVYDRIDASEKSITVPFGNKLLVGAIKEQLKKAGWKFAVYNGPIRSTGTLGNKVDIKTGETFKTRYNLLIRQQEFDSCVSVRAATMGSPAIDYDLSLIDNNSGGEVITQSGRDCLNKAVEKFVSALKEAEVSSDSELSK